MTDPRESKKHLRDSITLRLDRLSPKDRAAESRSICKRILEILPKEPSVICAYYPLKDEVDVRPLLKEIIALGHALYLPRKEGNHFVFRKVETVEALKPDDFRIPAPADDSPLLQPSELSIALIPGRAFDRSGLRLGRGNGGYDIWIRKQRAQPSMAAKEKARFWGVAFECQLTQNIPIEAHDERVDGVITARGMEQKRL